MGVRSEGNGHRDVWKLLIGLSVACAVLVFVGGFLHRRALESAVTDRQAKSVALVNTKVADAAKHTDLAKPLKDQAAEDLTKQLDLPAGTDLRLFSNAGAVLYSSPGLVAFPADAEGLQSATSGDPAHVVDDADLRVYVPVDGKGTKPVAIAAVVSNYTELRDDSAGPLDGMRLPIVALGVVLLVAGLLVMLQAAKGGAAEKVSAAASRPSTPKAKAPGSAKRRVTGFEPVPVTTGPAIQRVEVEEGPKAPTAAGPTEVVAAPVVADAPPTGEPAEPTAKTVFGLRLGSKKPKGSKVVPAEPSTAAAEPDPEPTTPKPKRSLFTRKDAVAEPAGAPDTPADKAASALDREIAIRQALEDQLEQLRTRMQMQDMEAANTKKELLAQLDAVNARAEQAEARARDAGAAPAPAPVPQPPVPARVAGETAMRIQQLEREVADARSVSSDAVARAEALQRQLDEAKAAPAADPAADAKLAEATAQLTDAQQRASAAEQRAASVESVRDELEVRVAQLGTKASELEQRATELETSLNEANAGGDAVRAEIATLTAALAAANARVSELESAPPPTAAHNEEDQTEIARLRGELANHMERAQAAEERVTTLEGDVLAAERGVSSLPAEAPSMEEAALDREPVVADQTTSPEPEEQGHEPQIHVASSPARDESNETVREDSSDVDEDQASATSEAPSDPEPVEEARVPEPVNRWESFTEARPDADEATSPSIDLEHVGEEISAPDETSGETAQQVEVEATEPQEVEVEATGPQQVEVEATEPVEPTASPEPAAPEPAPAIAWHAPTSTREPVASAALTNGDGIPPAPSDDARYDDIWTAAFAPAQPNVHPEAQPAATHAAPERDDASVRTHGSAVESEPAQQDPFASTAEPTTSAANAATPPANDVSPDDQPSPPEDEVSAEDDMWSLRARLAEAARKQLPHGND